MKGLTPVFKKETYSFFALPVVYVVCTIFAVISGYLFYNSLGYFSLMSFQVAQNPQMAGTVNLTDIVIMDWFKDIDFFMLLLMPLLSMRLFSEEKRLGTIELLYTYPMKDTGVLLGKYFALLLVFFIMLSTTLPNIIFVAFVGNPEWGKVLSGYLGLFLLGAAFLSLGLFTSSITENQVVASVMSFGALLLFWVIGWASSLVGPMFGKFLGYLSILDHMTSFTSGVIDLRDIVFYLLFTGFFLFATLRSIESQRG